MEIWKEFRKEDKKSGTPSHEEKTSLEEDDRWLEELTLTDMERISLEELEKSKLEDEKDERLGIAGLERRNLVKKIKDEADKKGKKKESKEETTRRLEESRRLEGKQKMKSGLWKQRREKDGRLVEICQVCSKSKPNPPEQD